MKKNLSQNLLKYLSRIFIQKTCKNVYRIDDWEINSSCGNERLIIQVINKNIYFKKKPMDLYTDDKLLRNFSYSDIRTITVLAIANENTPQYKIVMHKFREKLGKEILVIAQQNKQEYIEKEVTELGKNLEMIKKFDPEDAFAIGISYGIESTKLTQR